MPKGGTSQYRRWNRSKTAKPLSPLLPFTTSDILMLAGFAVLMVPAGLLMVRAIAAAPKRAIRPVRGRGLRLVAPEEHAFPAEDGDGAVPAESRPVPLVAAGGAAVGASRD
jgi:hypothetical protein